MLRTLSAGASLGAIYFLKTGLHPPGRGMLQAQEVQYMAAPLSDISGVVEGSNMRARMEKFIMTLQVYYDLILAYTSYAVSNPRPNFVQHWRTKKDRRISFEWIGGPARRVVVGSPVLSKMGRCTRRLVLVSA